MKGNELSLHSAGDVRQRMRDQGVLSGGGAEKKPAPEIPEDVPRSAAPLL